MSLLSSNRLLVAALLVGLGTAYYTIPILLQQVKDAARAPPPEPPPPTKRFQTDSENSLKIETLRTLADGYSYELRTSALKIVASRTVRSRTKHLLLRDLASRDYDRRDDAINGLWLFLYHPSLTYTDMGAKFYVAEGLTAVVRALVNVLPLHHIHPQKTREGKKLPPSPIRPTNRPAHEVSLLIILNNMLQEECRGNMRSNRGSSLHFAINAGLVTDWLAHYPFPCALEENSTFNYKKSDVVRLFDRAAWKPDDPLMADIIVQALHHPLGRKQLRDAGLAPSSDKEDVTRDTWADEANESDVRMLGGDDTAGIARDDVTDWEETVRPIPTARPRSTERSQEEEHLRRRHREAIVVAERGAPLRRENILQRENSHLLQPMEGVSEVEGVLNGLLGLSTAHAQAHGPPESFADTDIGLEHARRTAEDDREMDVREVELMIEASLLDPDVRSAIRAFGQLAQAESITLVPDDLSEGSLSPTDDTGGRR